MKKIVLLQPPVSFKEKTLAAIPNCPNLGLLYLASSLIKEGFDVKYVDISDNSLTLEEIKDFIDKEGIDIVGITAMTQNIRGAVQLARFLKENNCKAKIILGGPHFSADTTLLERFPYFDIGIAGESEITLVKIVKDLFNGKEVKGAFKGETPLNLDSLPPPARHLVDYSVYFKRGSWASAIFATRGCPYHCNFCSIPAIDKRVRFRSPQLIVEEIKECVKLTGKKAIIFCDDALTIDKKFVYSLCEHILKLPFHIKWEAQSRINYVDKPLLKMMKKAGCQKLLFGIESGNERIRNKVIGKGVTDKQIIEATKLCWEAGIEPDHYLMIGHPTETMREILDTVNCPLKFNPNIIGVFITMPLPGSPLFESAIEENVIDKDVIDKFITGKYGEGYEGHWPYYIPKGLTISDLANAKKLTNRKFYLRLSYILKRALRDSRSLVKIKRDISEGLSLLIRRCSASDYDLK
ncbi:MAG: radical SAM protein [Candidatus Omnitrophica bacterium]|nr:radical SAM protein [Candidatus Omnitrophota bacterium]